VIRDKRGSDSFMWGKIPPPNLNWKT